MLLQYMKKIQFWKIMQYLFFEQWKTLRTYANEHGVKIIGDLPIYVSLDSVDVWAHPELFQLDGDKVPREVAGSNRCCRMSAGWIFRRRTAVGQSPL